MKDFGETLKIEGTSRERILAASDVPPVNSFTRASKNGVSALPVMFCSLAKTKFRCQTIKYEKEAKPLKYSDAS